jgi:hypothetical protein
VHQRRLAVAAQRRLVALSASASGLDRKTVDECVDDTAELLDACGGYQDRLDMLRSYVTATRVALHWLDGHGGEVVAARRAAAAFAECEAVERRCGAELAKCGSTLRKLGERALRRDDEALAGARGTALLAVGALGAALAFRPRRAVPGVSLSGGRKAKKQWEDALQEVQRRVREEYDRRRKDGAPCMAKLDAAARAVKSSVATGGRGRCPDAVAAAARRRCDEMETAVQMFEEKVGELRRALMDVRMALMEWARRAGGPPAELLRLAVHSETSCPRSPRSQKYDMIC